MNEDILSFIKSQRVGVLAVEMLDGAPHAATVHFATATDTPLFIFETSRNYRKSEPVLANDSTRATFVVGFSEGTDSKTLQLDGTVRLLGEGDEQLKEAYLAKFPEKTAKAADPENIFFALSPSWWRFTDWSRPEGKTVILSDGTVTVAGKKVG